MRKRKKDQAYEEIRKIILRRRPAGDLILSENALAAELGMSRTPVREALQRLQMEGFVEIHPNRGVVVPSVSVREVNETFALRMAVEEFVLREMASRMSEDNLKEMDLYLSRQKAALEKNDVLEYLEHDKDFHEMFFRLYDNSLILSTIQRILDRFYSMGARVLSLSGSVEISFAEHNAIADAMRAGDGEQAAAAMHVHLTSGKNNVLSIPGNVETII